MPYHWGSTGLVTGDSANDLFGIALDPNVLIQESKVTTCDVVPGRRPRGPELLEFVRGYRTSAGVDRTTGTRIATVGAGAGKAHLEGARDPSLAGPDNGNGANDATGGGLTAGRRAGSQEGDA
jgi:formate dehydrogenase major subunit